MNMERVAVDLDGALGVLPHQCPWCYRDKGMEAPPGYTTRVCPKHRREMRRQIHQRREYLARRDALLH